MRVCTRSKLSNLDLFKLKAKLTPKAYILEQLQQTKRETELGIANPEMCVTMANGQVRATHALRDDLLAVLFPHSGVLPSELLQSRVRVKLKALTSGIQRALLPDDDEDPDGWESLSESGLLREAALIDFALARIAEDQLRTNLRSNQTPSPLSQLPVTLLSHENERLAEMARTLLHAEQKGAADDHALYHRLKSEHLHQLCWRVVAALIDNHAADSRTLSASAHVLLANHHSNLDPMAIARKLIFFLGPEYRDLAKDPGHAGLYLFVASLGREYNLDDDFVIRLIGETHSAPLSLLLRGQEIDPDAALGIMATLQGKTALAEMPELRDQYMSIAPVEARATIDSWRQEPVQ